MIIPEYKVWKPERSSREKVFTDSVEFESALFGFIEYAHQRGIPMLIGNFALYCGINQQSLVNTYNKDPEFIEVYQLMRQFVKMDLINSGLRGDLHQGFVKMLLSRNFGIKEDVVEAVKAQKIEILMIDNRDQADQIISGSED